MNEVLQFSHKNGSRHSLDYIQDSKQISQIIVCAEASQ